MALFLILYFLAARTRRPEKISWEDVFEAGSRVAQRTCDRVLAAEHKFDTYIQIWYIITGASY